MDNSTWERPFPTSMKLPPGKSTLLKFIVNCLTHGQNFETVQQVESHMMTDNRNLKWLSAWKCGHCLEIFARDGRMLQHLDSGKVREAKTANPRFASSQGDEEFLFPEKEFSKPNNALISLANKNSKYNALTNAHVRYIFNFGLDARLLRKRLYLEQERDILAGIM